MTALSSLNDGDYMVKTFIWRSSTEPIVGTDIKTAVITVADGVITQIQ